MQPDEITIRQAEEADLTAILKLHAQPDMDDGRMLDLAAAKAIFRRFAQYPHYRLYVAEVNGTIVGSYAFLVMDNLGHLGAPSAIIEGVVVDPARQGQGIGRAMMQHAMAQARAHGCYKLALSSNEKRQRAHAFYEGLGFRRHGYSFLIEFEERKAL